ncbi:serine/threonine-protein kinase [Planktothrix agardhii]|uniref:serine/threonine-protein kinase n=1 Tax=Planktothrix agardhii TaxID=1160 RepID=UPI00041F92CA|nr:serine/threonine-protein kinase [Planktothrix agardhii]
MSQLIYPGLVLRNHYAIVRELGHGGFGRTYLAKDQHRFDELCVLKEFSPQVQGSFALKKSQELFEREAEILYKLKHPQIPRFRELFRETIDNKGYLFFVQDYVEGFNYRSLLNQQSFTEAEVMQLLFQILPILDYIHSYGVIHRDISPDNMIQRQSDGLPMLIDFGGVKLIQAKVESELAVQGGQNPAPTRLGKVGYAPDEQMRLGMVYPNSDLYALAATMLVLLTRKEPQQLIDPQTLNWNWRKYTQLNPKFGEILDKMLAYRHGDRFSSVQDVLVALSAINPPPQTSINPTQPILNQSLFPQPFSPQAGKNSHIKTPLLVFVFILILGIFGWLGGRYGLNNYANQDLNQLAKTEEKRQEALREQLRLLGINSNFFVELVDEEFYHRYPEQRGRTLTDKSSDSIWRENWNKIADEFLQHLAQLSDQSRIKLGNYSINDLDHLKAQVNQLQLSSQSLYDLADAKFFDLFPEQSRNVDLGFPMGQVWQAITNDVVNNLEAGTAWERVEFASKKTQKTLKYRLKPGEGKIYIAHLNKNQVLQVRLKSPQSSTLLSIYTQKAQSLLEDSPKNRWSGRLPDSGDYQVVVVSKSSRPFDYELTLETR